MCAGEKSGEQIISRVFTSRRFLMETAVFYCPDSLCATSTTKKEQMSTPTKNTSPSALRLTPTCTTRWSAARTRARLARSFSKLCTQTGPTPWAEVETTEE